ncbi:MAG TPA: glycosyltransferase family 39 protein [Candidatus Cybelea sp.]|nr:glycosyltransferase family 39 protein [Candidatus Cybelea sp.]
MQRRIQDAGWFVLQFFVLLILTILLQVKNGAYKAEFTSDAAAHYITSLLVHDYVASGFAQPPIPYALNFDAHYAFVGFGLWPPAFYGLSGLWFLVFSGSKVSALVLSASITALLAVVAGRIARSLYGVAAGIGCALLLLAVPTVQAQTGQLMVDSSVALLSLLAALAFARYLDEERWIYSALFGLLAAAAIMTKGNGGLLALLPPAAVVLGRRWRILLRPSFWIPIPIVALPAVPWYLLTYKWTSAGFYYHWGWDYTSLAIRTNFATLYNEFGPGLMAFAAIGAVRALMIAGREERDAANALVVLCVLLACFAFQAIVPTALPPRYLLPIFAPLLVLSVGGVTYVANVAGDRLGSKAAGGRGAWLGPGCLVLAWALALAPFAGAAASVPQERSLAIQHLVEDVIARFPQANPTVAICSDGLGESAFATEVASRDPARPRYVVARGTRLFGGGGYRLDQYEERFTRNEDVLSLLDEFAIAMVVVDFSADSFEWGHNKRLAEIAADPRNGWKLISEVHTPEGRDWRAYEIPGNMNRPMEKDKLLRELAPRKDIR